MNICWQKMIAARQTMVAGGQDMAAGRQTTIAGGQEMVAGRQTTIAGGQEMVAGRQTTIAGGQEMVAGRQTTIAGEQEMVAGGQTKTDGRQKITVRKLKSQFSEKFLIITKTLSIKNVSSKLKVPLLHKIIQEKPFYTHLFSNCRWTTSPTCRLPPFQFLLPAPSVPVQDFQCRD
jgi:hypothetical protein